MHLLRKISSKSKTANAISAYNLLVRPIAFGNTARFAPMLLANANTHRLCVMENLQIFFDIPDEVRNET